MRSGIIKFKPYNSKQLENKTLKSIVFKKIEGSFNDCQADLIINLAEFEGNFNSKHNKILTKRFPHLLPKYYKFMEKQSKNLYGETFFFEYSPAKFIVNIFCVIYSKQSNEYFVNYDALSKGLNYLKDYIFQINKLAEDLCMNKISCLPVGFPTIAIPYNFEKEVIISKFIFNRILRQVFNEYKGNIELWEDK